jgi:hypothetical protein
LPQLQHHSTIVTATQPATQPTTPAQKSRLRGGRGS